jgi:hypothetical protein
MNHEPRIQWAATLCAVFAITAASSFAQQAIGTLTEEEAGQLGIDAVVDGFPLVFSPRGGFLFHGVRLTTL